MLFNKEFYYNYIKKLENWNLFKFGFSFFIISFSFVFVSLYFNLNVLLFTLLGIILGLIISMYIYSLDRLKIETYKMKFDIYNAIIDISRKLNNER